MRKGIRIKCARRGCSRRFVKKSKRHFFCSDLCSRVGRWRRIFKERGKDYQEHHDQAHRHHVRTRGWLADYKVSIGCVDCGFKYHFSALQLDHTGAKGTDISDARSSVSRLKEEIAKGRCVVRCANCHSIKTWVEKNGIEYNPTMFLKGPQGSSDYEIDVFARRYMAAFANKLDARLITRNDDKPYLWRGYLIGEGGGEEFNAFLHRFVSSDDKGFLHCHPWLESVSFILLGEYEETSSEGRDDGGKKILSEPKVVRYRPGMQNIIKANTFHRVDLVTPEVWTLFIHGPRVQPWGFVDEGTYRSPLSMRVVQGKTSENLPKKIMSDGGGI